MPPVNAIQWWTGTQWAPIRTFELTFAVGIIDPAVSAYVDVSVDEPSLIGVDESVQVWAAIKGVANGSALGILSSWLSNIAAGTVTATFFTGALLEAPNDFGNVIATVWVGG